MKPLILRHSGIRDNLDRGSVGDFLGEKIQKDSALSIVSAYFTIYAYAALQTELDTIEELRFLFGEPRFIRSLDPDRTESKAFEIVDDGLKLQNQVQAIESRVEQILAAKQADATADVSALEREIDELVYALYDLTPAEIALVEGREVAEALEAPAPVTYAFTGQPPQGGFSTRLARVEALVAQATATAVQELVAALTDSEKTIVWRAAAGLRQLGGPQVVGILQAFIRQTESASARAEAEKLLAQLE